MHCSAKKISRTLFLSAVILLSACSSHWAKGGADVRTAHAISGSGVASEGIGDDQGEFTSYLSEGELLAKRTYHFAFDSDRLTGIDRQALMAQAKYLIKHPKAKIILQGHTDERGSHAYNIALGWRRAKSVKRFLLSHGVNPMQIQMVSYGMEHPVALGHGEKDHQANRRVDLAYEN